MDTIQHNGLRLYQARGALRRLARRRLVGLNLLIGSLLLGLVNEKRRCSWYGAVGKTACRGESVPCSRAWAYLLAGSIVAYE